MSTATVGSESVQAVLQRAGWKPRIGSTVADGVTWLVEQYTQLRDAHRELQQEHEKVRDWLGARVEDVHALRAKFQNEQKDRLSTLAELQDLRRDYTDLEHKFYKGWRAERDRLRAVIDQYDTASRRLAKAMEAIKESEGRYRRKYTPQRHEWCVQKATQALKQFMPCHECCVRPCEHAFDSRNRGRVEGKNCLRVSGEEE